MKEKMLIRWANENDLPAWRALASEVSPIFQHPGDMGADAEFIAYAKNKAGKFEALAAVDYMSGKSMGLSAFPGRTTESHGLQFQKGTAARASAGVC